MCHICSNTANLWVSIFFTHLEVVPTLPLNLKELCGFVLIFFSIFSCKVGSEGGVKMLILKFLWVSIAPLFAVLAVSRSFRASCHSFDALCTAVLSVHSTWTGLSLTQVS